MDFTSLLIFIAGSEYGRRVERAGAPAPARESGDAVAAAAAPSVPLAIQKYGN